MTLIIHIIIALLSLVFSAYVFFSPSKSKLRMSYGLVAMTLISGTYLVISTHSPILSACTSGLIYLSVVMTATIAAQRKLATYE
jgi:predicted ATPase